MLSSVLLIALAVPAAEEIDVVNPYGRVLVDRQERAAWHFDDQLQGWETEKDARIQWRAGGLQGMATGPDPILLSPPVSLHGTLVWQMRMRSTAPGMAQIFWIGEHDAGPSESASQRFSVTADGQWHEYAWEFTPQETIRRLRFDPATGPGEFAIDWIRVDELRRHPLEIRRLEVTDRETRVWLVNHSNQRQTGRWLEQRFEIAPRGSTTLTRPRPAATAPFETIAVQVSADGNLPPVVRHAVVHNAAVETEWLTLDDRQLRIEIAPDGSGARIRRAGEWVAYVAPLVGLAGKPLPLTLRVAKGRVVEFGGGTVQHARLQLENGELICAIEASEPVDGPAIRAVGQLEQGLLAGVEHLGRGEASSSRLDIHGPEHVRFAPDPFHVTMPLMVCVTDMASVAMTWSDMELQPLFATPNFFDGTADHRLALRGRRMASRIRIAPPFDDGERLEDAVLWAVQRRGGLPDVPPAPRAEAEQHALSLRALTESGLRQGDAWFHAFTPGGKSLPSQPLRYADMGSSVFRLTGSVPPGPPFVPGGAHLANDSVFFLSGRAAEWRDHLASQARQASSRQQPDGSYRYRGEYQAGHFEDTASGYCARPAETLLEFARYTGDQAALEAARRTLDYMRRFRTPRGASTWECPLHAPDLLASALLVKAYVRGYEATGEPEYLRLAVRWALSGVPYVYLWSARPVMLYATTGTFCATDYTTPVWIGRPVQWMGLVYADALVDLAPHDATLNWRQLAEGLLVAAEQMQYVQGPSVGCLPDSWLPREQQPLPADINPCAMVSLRLRLAGKAAGLMVAHEGPLRVVSPFPVIIREGQAHVTAPAGSSYQLLVGGERVVNVQSLGADVVPLTGLQPARP